MGNIWGSIGARARCARQLCGTGCLASEATAGPPAVSNFTSVGHATAPEQIARLPPLPPSIAVDRHSQKQYCGVNGLKELLLQYVMGSTAATPHIREKIWTKHETSSAARPPSPTSPPPLRPPAAEQKCDMAPQGVLPPLSSTATVSHTRGRGGAQSPDPSPAGTSAAQHLPLSRCQKLTSAAGKAGRGRDGDTPRCGVGRQSGPFCGLCIHSYGKKKK